MALGIGGLVAAYIVTAVILTGLGLYSSWHWILKALGVIVVSASYLMLYFSIPPLLGWPTDKSVPNKFALLAVYMQEPDRVTGVRGDVFFWASDMAPNADKRPRAFRLPYTPTYKAVFQAAQGKLKNNLPQIGTVDKPDEGPFGVPKDMSRLGQKSINIQFGDVPEDLPPEKGTPQ